MLLPVLSAGLFVFGCYRHVQHRNLYNTDPNAFVSGAWMQLAAIHFFGAVVAFGGGVSAAVSGKISRGIPISVAVLGVAAFLAVPVIDPSASNQLMYPHPVPTTSIYIPMDDGVRLAADVFLPAGLNTTSGSERNTTNATSSDLNRAVPVVLQVMRFGRAFDVLYPYNKFSFLGSIDPRRAPGIGVDGAVAALINAGYAVVSIDVRGTGASFGRRGADLHPRELKDHSVLTDWAREQPWCNGTVALLGAGLDGTSVALAAARGASVNAVATVDSPADPYSDQTAPGGITCKGYIQFASSLSAAVERTGATLANIVSHEDYGWTAFALKKAVGSVSAVAGWENEAETIAASHSKNFDIAVLASASSGLYRDTTLATGKTRNLSYASIDAADRMAAGLSKYHVPLLAVAGFSSGRAAASATGLYNRGLPAGSQIVLGPWGGAGKTCFGTTAEECRTPQTTPAAHVVAFFDCTIRGQCATTDPITFFTTGDATNSWRTASAWPPTEGLTSTTLYLTPTALTGEKPTAGLVDFLVDQTATTGERSRWNTVRGLVGLPIVYTGSTHGRISFDSTPLTGSTIVVGSPLVTLSLEAVNGADIALFVYLEEVFADGRVTYVTEGQILASHQIITRMTNASIGHPEPFCRNYTNQARTQLAGPSIVELVLEPTAHRFSAGSQMRLALAGADTENFDTAKLNVAPQWKIHIGDSSISIPLQQLVG